jgi:hypothetical protein
LRHERSADARLASKPPTQDQVQHANSHPTAAARKGAQAVVPNDAAGICLEHGPEEWNPVFRKDHAPTKS